MTIQHSDKIAISALIFTKEKDVTEFFKRYGQVYENLFKEGADIYAAQEAIIGNCANEEILSDFKIKDAAAYGFVMKSGVGFSMEIVKKEAKRNLHKHKFILYPYKWFGEEPLQM